MLIPRFLEISSTLFKKFCNQNFVTHFEGDATNLFTISVVPGPCRYTERNLQVQVGFRRGCYRAAGLSRSYSLISITPRRLCVALEGTGEESAR
jgi:hypothetical protein